ncbi:MAG: xanthine dehydrogenase family protein subunit M [Geobacteraceae bacterium]|nr:xanthine dehydrogenase family protein subunit M [Geobacteraceae bacterium]
MYMPDYEYHAPGNLAEACALLGELGGKVTVLAGGSDVLHKMKIGSLAPDHLVSLKNLKELREIRYEQGRGVVIGALVTHDGIYRSQLLQEHFLSLPMAAHTMANTQITNIGTIGGNIVNGSPLADLPPILVALGASVKLVGRSGERVLPLEEFIVGPGKTVIAQDEILTEIVIPDQATTGSTYKKFGLRKSGALAVVSVAAAVTVEGGTITDARIVLGAVAPVPLRAKSAEASLKGKKVSDAAIEEAAAAAAADSRPISDLRGSDEYRRELVRVFTKRALRKAIDEGHV